MLNEKGYYRPTYDEEVQDLIQQAKELFGDDIATDSNTVMGKIIRLIAYKSSKSYEDIEGKYYARFPNTAIGTSLDRLLPFAGITRNPAIPAQHTVKVYGKVGFTFGIGELVVSSENGTTFYSVDETSTIGADGTTNVVVECTEAGTIGNATITDIVNPISEISAIEYVGLERAGEEEETDLSLRKRFASAIVGAGNSNKNSIMANILRVMNVNSVYIAENDTDDVDSSGRPARSFECYVYGYNYDDTEVATAIFDKAPLGIKTCSTSTGDNKVSVTLKDDGGYDHVIEFSRTENIDIMLSIKYKKNTAFGETGETDIRNALVEYINSLGVGGTVILSKLYEYIYGVTGVTEVTELKISIDNGSSFTTDNVSAEGWQIAHLSANNVILAVIE